MDRSEVVLKSSVSIAQRKMLPSLIDICPATIQPLKIRYWLSYGMHALHDDTDFQCLVYALVVHNPYELTFMTSTLKMISWRN